MADSNVIPLPRPAVPAPIAAAVQAALKPRDRARALLEEALATGIRGTARESVKEALRALERSPTHQLADLEYQALKPGQKLLDPQRPGFLARATQRGVRLMYRHSDAVTGRQTEVLIGFLKPDDGRPRPDAVTLAEARARWSELRQARLAGLQLAGTPPGANGGEVGAPRPGLPTMRELAVRFRDEYVRLVQRPRSQTETERLLWRHVVPAYGEWTVDRFTAQEARTLFAGLDSTPRERDKLRVALSTQFNVAVGRTRKLTLTETWLPADFANPVTNAQTARHEPQGYSPITGEIRRYAAGLRTAEMRQDYRDALELQLLTASRIAEVVEMEWSEVDLAAGVWALPPARSKNRDRHEVFLSPQALAILERRQQDRVASDRFVFPSPLDRTKPVRCDIVQRALADRRPALGVSAEFTSHAVRHAFTAWAASTGLSVEVANRCTAHRVASGINRIYNHYSYDPEARAAWRGWADYLYG